MAHTPNKKPKRKASPSGALVVRRLL